MENWKSILGYEGLYEASDFGRVRSIDRVVDANSRWGTPRKMLFKGTVLQQFIGTNDYMKVTLSKEGKTKSVEVHRLVYEAFNGKVPDGMQVNHIDEDRQNNKLTNLNILTPQENTNYGNHNKRVSKTMSKKVFQYDLNHNLIAEYESTKDAAIKNDFDQATISACARGKKSCHTYKGYIWTYNPL